MKPDWEMIGPWLGNRAIEKEIGYPVYNDPETMWAVIDSIGFITYRENGHIDCLYVEPESRLQGYGAQLVGMALKALHGKCYKVRVSANSNSYQIFQSYGFTPTTRTKNFTRMERNA